MTDQATMADGAQGGESTGTEQFADIADVFGISLDPEPPVDGGDSGDDQNSLVGTKEAGAGSGEGGTEPSPAGPAPAAPAGGNGSAAPAQQSGDGSTGQQGSAPPQAPDPRDLELSSVKGQLAQVLAELEAMKKPGATPGAGQPGQTPGQGQPQQPQQPAAFDPNKPELIQVQLPQQFVETLFSDDPQQATGALNQLVTSIASGLTHRFRSEMHQALGTLRQELMAQAAGAQTESAAQDTAAQQREQYFAKFPEHNKPLLMPILGQAVAELVGEFPGASWDDTFIAAVGARVNEKIQASGITFAGPGNPTATQGQAPASGAPAAPAPMMPTGSRPEPSDALDIIAETFS